MREEESNWFSKWEEDLPSPEELMPLSQTLITPDLAIAFDIPNPNPNNPNPNHSPPELLHQTLAATPPNNASSAEFVDSAELGGGDRAGSGGDEPARTLKRPRLVWTPQLHKRFVDAVAHLGIKNAVPKTIMQLMSVDGLTRENVASHLQKYRLYLKRMQGISSGGGGGSGAGSDPATDHLFASSPVPAHFLHPGPGPASGRPGPEHFLPTFVPYHHHPPPPPPQQHHHQQYRHIGLQQNGHIGLQNGHIGLQSNGQFEHPFMSSASARPVLHRIGGGPVVGHHGPGVPYVEDVESGANGRRVLTLFPTGDD